MSVGFGFILSTSTSQGLTDATLHIEILSFDLNIKKKNSLSEECHEHQLSNSLPYLCYPLNDCRRFFHLQNCFNKMLLMPYSTLLLSSLEPPNISTCFTQLGHSHTIYMLLICIIRKYVMTCAENEGKSLLY